MSYQKNLPSADELRRLAQERFTAQKNNSVKVLTQDQAEQLFSELSVHQIELELQNEHLSQARAQLEAALTQSSDLYNFSPVGCVTLDLSGIITKLNLVAAQLMGYERSRLLGNRVTLFFAEAQHAAINALFDQTLTSGDIRSEEFLLVKEGFSATHVQVRVAPLANGQGLQITLLDISETRQFMEAARLREERWKFAIDATGDGLWDWNVVSGEIIFSPRYLELCGYSADELEPGLENWMARIHPDDKPQVVADLQAHLAGRTTTYVNEHRKRCKDGHWMWVLSRGAVVERGEAGAALRMVGTHADITNRKQNEEALLAASRFQQAVFDSLASRIVVIDQHGKILQTNLAWHNYAVSSGFPRPCAIVGSNYLNVLERVAGAGTDAALAALAGIRSVIFGKQQHFQLEYSFQGATGLNWFIMRAMPVLDAQGRVVVSHEDITALKSAELTNLRLVNFDAPTTAFSRSHFFSVAEQELARSRRYTLPLMVLMLDVDHLKLINDEFGHTAGDAVLKGFVQVIRAVLRESDLIGRIGGKRFAVLLPNTVLEGGQALAQRITDEVLANPLATNQQRIAYTVSIGTCSMSDETCFSDLLNLAENSLHKAKQAVPDRQRPHQVSAPALLPVG